MRAIRILGRIILIPVIILLTLILTLMVVIQIPSVQTKAAQYAIKELNKSFGTEISVDKVSIDFFGDVILHGVKAKDDRGHEFVDIKKLQATLSVIDIVKNSNDIRIKKLILYDPKVDVITYKGETISNFIQLIESFDDGKEPEEPSKFKMSGDIRIKNGDLLIQNQNLEGHKQNWVEAKNFNLDADNFKLIGDEIWADFKRFSFDGKRNGEDYQLQNLLGKFHYSKQEIRIDEMDFITQDSWLKGHIVLSYDTPSDMKDFLNKVKWDLEFKEGSKVNFKDIRYFVDEFDKDNTVNIQGLATGPLNDMVFNNLQISGDGAYVAANRLHMIKMTEGENIIIESNSLKAKSSYNEFNRLMPNFITKNIPDYLIRFGTMDYKGDFKLDPRQISVNGNAITALGTADLRVLLDDYKGNLRYSGSLAADNVNLNQITGVKELGYVMGKINFSGQGTDVKNLGITADGDIVYLDLLGKRYNNVKVDGKLDHQKFKGLLSINDPRLQGNYDGLFDFSQKTYQLDFKSHLQYLDLDYLGLTSNLGARIRAGVEGDFSFSNLDDFLGKLSMKDVRFISKKDTLELQHAEIVSSREGELQSLDINLPEYLEGSIKGKYRLSQLPDTFLNFLGSSALITYEPKPVDKNQKFDYYFDIKQDLFSKIEPRLEVSPGTVVEGTIDTEQENLVTHLNSPWIGYDGIYMFTPQISVDNSKESEQILLKSDSINIKGTSLYRVDMQTTPIQDSLMIKTTFQYGKDFPIDFNLNLFQTLDLEKNLVLGFSPSTITVDEIDWKLNPKNDKNTNRAIINFDRNYYELQKLSLEAEEQKLLLDGYYASNVDYKLNADLRQLILSEIIPKQFIGNLKIDGIANGDVDIIRTEEKLEPLMGLTVTGLGLNDYSLGDLNINGVYNVENKVFDLTLFLDQEDKRVLDAAGYIDNKPESPEINLAANLNNLRMKFLEGFLSAAMSNIRGDVSGLVTFTGPIDSPSFDGELAITDLGFRVDFLNVDYSFDGVNTVPVHRESHSQGFISLDEVKFRDTAYDSKGEVTGELLFRDFSKWFLNLSFNTNNLLVMNTKMKHNDLFYGRIFGQGAFEMFGPPERLDISATAIINEGSELTINTGATKVEGKNSLVRFIPESEITDPEDRAPKGLNIDLDITADPSSTINLIFDPMTNDMVIANGSTKNMLFRLSRSGVMSLTGTYTLEQGIYQLRQVPLLGRDFEIKPGSFVSWGGGSAFDASMEITANFERPVSNVGEYLGAGFSQTYDVMLGIVITESLANPKMDFTLQIPKGGTDVQSLIDYKFNLDPDSKIIQFGSVLVMGQFLTDADETLLTTGAVASTGAGFALKQLGGILNSFVQGTGIFIDMDYVSGSPLSNTSDLFKTGLKVNLSPRWTINGEVGVPVGTTYANETATGEVEIDWDVSEKMTKDIVVNFFTRPTNFGVQNFGGAGNYQSFGAGITYKTSFDQLNEIFIKRDNKKDLKLPEVPPVIFESEVDESESNMEKEENDTVSFNDFPVLEKSKDTINKLKITGNKEKKKGSNSLVRFK